MKLRGKTIACFVALAHHTRFLLPITEAAAKAGANVLFFLPLSDYPFERDLTRLGYSFRFIPEYVDEELKIKIANSYNQFVDTWAERYGRWDGVCLWPLFEQERSMTSCIEECFCVERFIQKEKPDIFLALHERNRWGKTIGHLANKYGVPFVTLQEGDYHESRLSFSAHTEFSTVDLLWGQACKDTLVQHRCAEDKIVLTGNTHLDTARRVNTTPQNIARVKRELKLPADKKIVLVLTDLEWGAIIDERIWREFMGNFPADAHLVFKWHPNVKRSTMLGIQKTIETLAPQVTILYMHDAYELLAVADYCVTLGKTTLALEAVAFGKPLFALPSFSSRQQYYADLGVALPIDPIGNWNNLIEVMRGGMPAHLQTAIDRYLTHSFYKLDGKAAERAVAIIDYIVEQRDAHKELKERRTAKLHFERAAVPGRVSFVVPGGHDGEAFLATVTSLARNVGYPDWELVVTVNDAAVETVLENLGGDIVVVKDEGETLGRLYNKGAELASGETLIFIKPGTVFLKGEGLIELAQQGVTGTAIRDAQMAPLNLGYHFDFNYVPQPMTHENATRDAVGGGLLALSRALFETLGGFDAGIADYLIEPDLCLTARRAQAAVHYAQNSLAACFKETFPALRGDEQWQPRVKFFAKWAGELPKDDDYLNFAKSLLQV